MLPYVLNWTYEIPASQMNNHTFSQSLEIRYVANGCGGTPKCPQVVNYTIKIQDGVTNYNQSLNMTLLNLKGFYAGADGAATGPVPDHHLAEREPLRVDRRPGEHPAGLRRRPGPDQRAHRECPGTARAT